MQETCVPFLGQEDPLEKKMTTHSSIPPWKSHGQRSLVGYSPWGHKESDTTEHAYITRVAELKNWIYGHWIAIKTNSESEVTQSCPTLCDPSVYGVFQARVLEWGTISFSRRSSRPRDWTQVSCIAGRHFTIWATREIRNACWRRLLRVPWTARKSNQSILKISPECSLEGLMLKLKLPILWPPDVKSWLIGKDRDAGKDWGQEEKGMTEDEIVRWHHWLNGHGFG